MKKDMWGYDEIQKEQKRMAEQGIEEEYCRDWHIRPPPHIRPVLLLDLIAKGCTSYKVHKFKEGFTCKIDDLYI
jgi:hypothetical protein